MLAARTHALFTTDVLFSLLLQAGVSATGNLTHNSHMHGSPKPLPSQLSRQLPGGVLRQAQIGPLVLPPLVQQLVLPMPNLDSPHHPEISPKEQYHQRCGTGSLFRQIITF